MDWVSQIIADAGLGERSRKSRWPARLDVMQSLSGLALFMWGHMLFVSSILISKDAMWTITKMFEGYFVFGRGYPWIVSIVVGCVFALFIGHAVLALHKFPINYRQFRTYRGHMQMMQHEDTTLWFWQVFTGFALFFGRHRPRNAICSQRPRDRGAHPRTRTHRGECGCCVAACGTARMREDFVGAVGLNKIGRFHVDPRDGRSDAAYYELIGDDAGVFGCMSLLGCHDVCPKNLPLQTQIAFVRRKMAAQGIK